MKKLYLLIILFLVISSYIIIKLNNIDLEEEEGRKTFLTKLTSWLFRLGKSSKNVISYATRQKWLPEKEAINKTNMTFPISED